MFNKIILVGNLCSDVTASKVGDKQTPVATFRVAVNNPRNKNDTLFIKAQAWSKTAEFAEKYLAKGKKVLVEGSLKDDSWKNDKDEKVFSVVVNVDNLQLLSFEKKEGNGDSTAPAPAKSDDVSDDIPF